jgi:hypothetical protein
MGRTGKVAAAAGALLLALSHAAVASVPGAHAGAALPGPGRVVSYLGYQVRVPASWPVYRLAADPSRCVLFNRHAVYLGRPGADQRCPVRAFGRTESLLVQPLTPLSDLPPSTTVQRGQAAARRAPAAAALDAASHALSVALPAAGVQVAATYGANEALVRAILAGARLTSTRPAAGHPAAPIRQPAPSRQPASRRTAASQQPAPRQRAAAATTLTAQRGTGLGFDACTAPSVATMAAWLNSPFRVAGTYLGGVNWACSYGNFTQSWVSQVAAQGWRFIPVWVGPQAPCSTIPGAVLINPAQAAAEGKSEAASAVSTAAGFGYGTGTLIYFDMEAYDNSNTSCKQAVLNFLSGWTQGLHAAGANLFENSSGKGTAATSQLTSDLTHYALAGTLPDEGTLPAGPTAPTMACLGSPTVPAG